ncbi:MAG: putative Ig domain-containing protein, partial [Pseudomonadales bacterium]
YLLTPGDLSASTTYGLVDVLIDGKEEILLGEDIFQDKPIGIELVENNYTIGGTTLQAGTLLLTMDGDKGIYADNTQLGERRDIYALTVEHTTLVNGSTSATVALLFEGADVGLDSDSESLDALSFTEFQGGDSDPLLENPIPDQLATEEVAFSFSFAGNTFFDADGSSSLTYSASLAGGGALPGWLSFNAGTRTFSGTPLNADVGTISIAVTADDGSGGTPATSTFDIVTTNTNDDPALDNAIPDQGATEDSPFSFTFNANSFSDVDVTDSLTYSATLASGGALPGWLTFNDATRTFSGTPLNADVGMISITVTADDGQGGTPATSTFDLVIANSNDDPTLDNPIPDQIAPEDSPFSFSFNANTFNDVDATDSLLYSATLAGGGALPGWLTFDAATRTFSGTPLQADLGSLNIEVTADDGQGGTPASDTFRIAVGNTNDAPQGSVILSDNSPGQGDVLTAVVSLSDDDGLGAFSYQWQRDGVDIAGANTNSYIVTSADVNSQLTLVVSYVDGFGQAEKVVSDTAVFVAVPIEPELPKPETGPEPEVTDPEPQPDGNSGQPETQPEAAPEPPVDPVVQDEIEEADGEVTSVFDDTSSKFGDDEEVDNISAASQQVEIDSEKNETTADAVNFELVRLQAAYTPYNDPLTLMQFDGFVDGVDQLRENIAENALSSTPIIGSTFAVSAGMSAGYIAWLARSGAVLGSVMSAMPMWRFIDPLPVLNGLGSDDDDDEESLQAIIENSNQHGENSDSSGAPDVPDDDGHVD